MRPLRLAPLFFLLATAAQPATDPSDSTVDQLLNQATTAPSTPDESIPATQPAVLQSTHPIANESRPGVLIFSDGSKITGKLSTTLRQPIRVWDDEKKEYQDLPFSLIQSMEAQVVWEREEKEWKFAASGSDIKEYSGRSYPARYTTYKVTLKDGTIISGDLSAPLYLDTPDGPKTYILHKTDKGDVGETMEQLVYIKAVRFAD